MWPQLARGPRVCISRVPGGTALCRLPRFDLPGRRIMDSGGREHRGRRGLEGAARRIVCPPSVGSAAAGEGVEAASSTLAPVADRGSGPVDDDLSRIVLVSAQTIGDPHPFLHALLDPQRVVIGLHIGPDTTSVAFLLAIEPELNAGPTSPSNRVRIACSLRAWADGGTPIFGPRRGEG